MRIAFMKRGKVCGSTACQKDLFMKPFPKLLVIPVIAITACAPDYSKSTAGIAGGVSV